MRAAVARRLPVALPLRTITGPLDWPPGLSIAALHGLGIHNLQRGPMLLGLKDRRRLEHYTVQHVQYLVLVDTPVLAILGPSDRDIPCS